MLVAKYFPEVVALGKIKLNGKIHEALGMEKLEIDLFEIHNQYFMAHGEGLLPIPYVIALAAQTVRTKEIKCTN